MAALQWSKKKPTEAGWWWYRSGKMLSIVRVIETQRGLAVATSPAEEVAVLRGEWAGPVEHPKEEK